MFLSFELTRQFVRALLPLLAVAAMLPFCANARAEQEKVLVLLATGFNKQEFYGSTSVLSAHHIPFEIASIQVGPVCIDPAGNPHPGLDPIATLGLGDVKLEGYSGLLVPGGYSPGWLEKDARALTLVRAFAKTGKPMAFICHAPRLLMRTGLLEGRRFTCLFQLPDELADEWRERPFGEYLDEPLVVDKNLVTARYPNDVHDFAEAFVQLMTPGAKAPASPDPGPLPAAEQLPTEPVKDPQGLVALREGFDERAAAAACRAFKSAGLTRVAVCAAEAGVVTSVNGLAVKVQMAYPDTVRSGAIIVAPGFFWPQKNTEARQAVQPAWIDDQEKKDASREAWLLKQRDAGATLVLVGLDALRVGRETKFAGAPFATIAPAMWSFPRDAGKYSPAPFVKTADNLFTASGADSVSEAIAAALNPNPNHP